jgi:aryl-alcohol dehydrogenase-like predicted oxidoreductase
MAFAPAEKPKSLLGYHRILSPTAGVRVSPLCLGAMNFGDAWKGLLGECDKETAFKILDYFYENGGNFIDTANNYQAEESEAWIGEWLAARQNRDQMVIATKFTTTYPAAPVKIKSNYQGNHSKSLRVSLEASLKKLQTSYIDLLYVHWWDFSTSIPEIMHSLHHMVVSGKVLYLGISDTPAWIVSKANEYARQQGLTQFSVYQGLWSAADRDFERDIIPMCESEGMALAPWGSLGRGKFMTPEDFEKKSEGRTGEQPENVKKVAATLADIAKRKNTQITSVALAYVMHKSPYVFPIVGGRKIEHLKSNIEGLSIELSDGEIDEIEDAAPFDIGFPLSFLFGYGGQKYSSRMTTSDLPFVKPAGSLDVVQKTKPPKPHKD